MQEPAEDSSAQSNVSEATQWQADDGFKDEPRSNRRRGQRRDRKAALGPATDDSSDAEPGSASSTRQGKEAHLPNGFSKVNGRPERRDRERDRPSGDSREGFGENGGEHQTRQRSHHRNSPHDWARNPERTGSAKVRLQPRVVPLPTPLPSDKAQARGEKTHPPERPASAAAGQAPSQHADDGRPASAHAGPSPTAAAARAAASAQDWAQLRPEPAANASQAVLAQPVAAPAGSRDRAQPQQITRPQPSRPPAERPRAAPIESAAPVQAPPPVRIASKAAAPALDTAKSATLAVPEAPSSTTKTPVQVRTATPPAPAQAPAQAARQPVPVPLPAPVGAQQHAPALQSQPVVPIKGLPPRPAVDAPEKAHPPAEQVSLSSCVYL